ncbi:hypothetical protein BEP19_11835 [Ammoniphilus oxalaticus]|uniref:Carboxypeptidase regulatory-like domain-containing protein n=1 Tax=Ammoniphilus oxalaticus TaxID=66863 RepID=A0A419SGL7_9BACL|nr:CueP family metal-binding protein [Ammoniphilus oxalaticus]RKD22919.1 hypothetical protein BEP19_11835 [Ammoniphilus oxalaticus]
MTGCQGELVAEKFDVQIHDEQGRPIIDTMIATEANGFFDLWLPRNQTYQVKIQQGDKVAEAKLATFKDDPTCITTMQLQ